MGNASDVIRDLAFLFAGGLLGLLSGILLFWLESRRESSRDRRTLRRSDYRTALRYARSGRRESLAGADLQGMNLTFVDLEGCDLRHANLRRCQLYRANLSGAMLAGADLSETTLVEADLSKSDLWRANLRRADLRQANLREAKMLRANLQDADLRDADFSDVVIEGDDGLYGIGRVKLEGAMLEGTVLDTSKQKRPNGRSRKSEYSTPEQKGKHLR